MAAKPITIESIKLKLEKIKEKYPKPIEDPIFAYLESLYRLHRRFGEPEEGDEIFKFFNAEYERFHHRGVLYSYFRVMVGMTVPDDTPDQYKSRYANALQYAFDRKIKSDEVVAFMHKNGGYKGCDELHRKQKKKAKARKRK
jgi:hypothetical protein